MLKNFKNHIFWDTGLHRIFHFQDCTTDFIENVNSAEKLRYKSDSQSGKLIILTSNFFF